MPALRGCAPSIVTLKRLWESVHLVRLQLMMSSCLRQVGVPLVQGRL